VIYQTRSLVDIKWIVRRDLNNLMKNNLQWFKDKT